VPGLAFFRQPDLEHRLRAAADRLGVEVREGAELQGLGQDADGVTAVVVNEAGETEDLRGSFIVSAEGGRSIVRKTLDIDFEGYTYPERTLTATVCHDFDKLHGYAYRVYLSDPQQWSNLFKWTQPERWRVHFPTHIDDEPERLLSDEHIQSQLQRFLPNDRPYEIVHRILYTVHQRVAATFNRGRAILAGDSAHVNSPIGAMGMNSGIHDAVNLAGNMLRVLSGEENEGALDRYVRQRRHVATEHVQTATIANKANMEQRDPEVRRRYRDQMRRAAEDPILAKKFLMKTSLIDSLKDAAQIQ
jgi:3-(3-hydroxy-phenyl)propionate hydroxylase